EPKAGAVNARIVGDEREILHARVADSQDQRFRDATEAKAAGQDGHAVLQLSGQCRFGVGIDLLHQSSPPVRLMDLEYDGPGKAPVPAAGPFGFSSARLRAPQSWCSGLVMGGFTPTGRQSAAAMIG